MESKPGWVQTSRRSWEGPRGEYVVMNHCPREGGTYYTRFFEGKTEKWPTLERAQHE